MNKIELERELEEMNETEFIDKLRLLLNTNTAKADGSTNPVGRPRKNSAELTSSGIETRSKGSNIEKGGNI
mgnify:CR=1 FL=1